MYIFQKGCFMTTSITGWMQKKGRVAEPPTFFRQYQITYFRMASLAAFATRNLTTFFAGMLMVAPVAGLRPMRA